LINTSQNGGKDMPKFVICPACNEENSGGALLCSVCRSSLIGIPRQERMSTEVTLGMQKETVLPHAAPEYQTVIETAGVEQPAPGIMFEKIRSWGMWSLLLGALHIFTSGFLSAPWGILLILVGLASFYFRSASMFVIYAATLGWAALSNVRSFDVGWVGFSLYQFFLAFRVFQDYRTFREVDAAQTEPGQPSTDRAARFFPWLAPAFGCSSIIGLVLILMTVIVMMVAAEGNNISIPESLSFLEGLAVNFGVLGAAIGLASVLSRYPHKALGIVGIVAGTLTILLEMALIYL
jgi:hypothetical protein